MEYVLTTEALTKRYKHFSALNGLSLHVPKGAIYGLVGQNGAGKTTLIRLICGLQKPTEGRYTLYGADSGGKEITKVRRRMGAVVETPSVYQDMTAEDNLKQQYRILGLPSFDGLDEILDLVRLSDTGKKKAKDFSLGMRQRLGIAISLVGDPDFLVLDEPVNGLDPQGIVEMRELILKLNREKQITFLISSHILSEIALLADDIGIIDHGALLEEESLAELEAKSSRHIRFTVSSTTQAARILERNFHETQFTIQDDYKMRLHNLDISVGEIVTAFVENGLTVSEAYVCEESLEDYFKRVTGGEGIA